MKTKILAIAIIMMASVTLNAQTYLGIGVQKELFGVSLNPENAADATFSVDKVDVSLLVKEHLRIGLGYQAGTKINRGDKRYEMNSGLSLSFAYLFDFKNYKDFSLAPTLSVGNSFRDFGSFKNLDVDLGVRAYIMKSFFLGTGYRYAHWNQSEILNENSCHSWYFEIGYNFNFKRKK